VTKRFESNLLEIDDSIKDKIHIKYDEKPVEEIHQIIFFVENIGDDPIKDVGVHFQFSGFQENDFLDVVLANKQMTKVLNEEPVSNKTNHYIITIPFLNPKNNYDDYWAITFYTPRKIKVESVNGMGYGWATKYVDRIEIANKMIDFIADGATPLGWLVAQIARYITR
jgi:hypothetical protein